MPNKVAIMLDGQPLGSEGWVTVNTDGTFAIDLPNQKHWSTGSKHILSLYGQDGKFITSTAFIVEAATPSPTK